MGTGACGRHRADDGFTLVELMVVVLIIGLLVAVAVPKFLSTQRTARARAAQTSVRAAEVVLSSVFIQTAGFEPIDLPTLTKADATMFPATALAGASSSRPNEIAWAYVNAGTPTTDAIGADGIILAARSRDNVCYMLRVDSTSHVFGQRSAPTPADCVATAAPDVNPSTNFRWSADPAVQWN